MKTIWSFVAGFAVCYVLVRVFKTQDADFGTYALLGFVPFWLMAALTTDD